MKKFLDRYLFSKLGLQIAFSVIIILLFSFVGTQIRTLVTNHKAPDVYSQTFWGFRQITDGGSMAGTLDDLDTVAEQSGNSYGAPVVLTIALVSWLIGMVLYSFVTGAVVNAFEGRKDKIEGGRARYKFRGHGIVVGWDFQGVASVMAMLDVWKMNEVLVVSEKPSEEIRAELENELDEKSMRKIFIYNGTLGTEVGIEELYPEKSRAIIVLGDRDDVDNDGGNMRIGTLLRNKINESFKTCPPQEGAAPIQLLIDVSNTYNLGLSEMHPAEGYAAPKGLSVQVFNFCKATVRELYSSFAQFADWNTGRRNGLYEASYRPLAFRRNAEASHVHLLVSGIGDMAKAIVLELAPLIAAGKENGVITVFSSDAEEMKRFASAYPFGSLQGVRVEFVDTDIDDEENRERLLAAVRDVSASVTVFVTDENADNACAMVNRLPAEIRFENVRLMIEQRILSKWAHKTYPLQLSGFGDVAFFGFTDRFFASLGQRLTLEDRLLQSEVLLTPNELGFYGGMTRRDRYFAASFADGLLENLVSQGYRFEYNPARARMPVLEIPEDELDELVRFEHARNVNFQLLHGVVPGERDDDVFNTSTTIVSYDQLGEDARLRYAGRIKHSLGVLESLYNRGDYPYIVEKNDFRRVVGVLPAEDFDESPEARRSVRNAVLLDEISASKWRQPDGKEKSDASIAMVLVPGRGLARQMYRLSFLHSIPMIVILPCPRERFISESGLARTELERWLRNAYSVQVAEDGDVESVIRSMSTLIVNEKLSHS